MTYFEAWLDPDAGTDKTCGHRHETVEAAMACARQPNPEQPLGVLRFDGDKATYVGGEDGRVWAWWGEWRGSQ